MKDALGDVVFEPKGYMVPEVFREHLCGVYPGSQRDVQGVRNAFVCHGKDRDSQAGIPVLYVAPDKENWCGAVFCGRIVNSGYSIGRNACTRIL